MTTSDSVIVRVRFGVEPRSGDGVARFAVQEQAVAPTSWNRPPAYPSTEQAYGVTGEVRLAFVVDSTGVVDRTTIRVLRASTREFADAAVRAVSDYRFIPEELNCRRLAIVVEEPFVFGQKMQRPSTAPS